VGDAKSGKRDAEKKAKRKVPAASIVNPRAKRYIPKKAKIGE
jgi:hypothetical protein